VLIGEGEAFFRGEPPPWRRKRNGTTDGDGGRLDA
jgi:hypothetical protein